MVAGVGRQAQLGEDARDVLLDCALGDEEPVADRLVRPALRHQLEHLALARRELGEWVVLAAPADELGDDGGIERRPSLSDPAHGRCELADVRHTVLEQVADTLGALGKKVECVFGLDVLGEDDHAGGWMLLADFPRRSQAFVGVCRRHPDVDDRHLVASTSAP